MGGRFNDMGEGKIEGRKLDPRTIQIRTDFNFRDMTAPATEEHISWLMTSIRENGVQEPIRVQYANGEIYLVSGHCRVEACKRLFEQGLKVPYKSGGYGPPLVPAIVVQGDEAELLAASVVANGGLPPTKLEFGQAADRLLKLGWPIEKIALYVPAHIKLKGIKAERYVRESVDLHHAPIGVKKAVRDGVDGVKVSEGLALKATRENPMQAAQIVQEAAVEAKAKGKDTARRPKGPGAKTREREGFQVMTDKLFEIGDELARLILDGEADWNECKRQAKAWQRLRG